MTVFDHIEFDNHEQVVFCRNAQAGLSAIVAIHSTALGPAAGGCRMWPYASADDALTDVLRLSKAMSYKSALAGLPLGGGKAVILGDPAADKNEHLLHAFGRCVQHLGGRYWTAEDVGTGLSDVHIIGEQCDFVFGTSVSPAPYTAMGVFEGMRAAIAYQLERGNFRGLRVAVQGLGNVGRHLCHLLHDAGAELVVTDINPEAIAYAVEFFDAEVVAPAAIYAQPADVFAPCALGGILNDVTIPQLQATIVAGAANNQLGARRHAQMLVDRGILYAPDYLINAGGMLSASRDILHDEGEAELLHRIRRIYTTALHVFATADEIGRTTADVADSLAQAHLAGSRLPEEDLDYSGIAGISAL